MSKISELSDGGVIQGGDTLIAVRSGGNVKVTYGGTTTANIDGGTIDNTVIGGTTPAAGNFTTGSFTGNVSFGDNDKAIFGAGSDLQIYHDGSNSLIQDAGTGDLIVKSNGTATVIKTNAGNNLLSARDAGSVGIFHDGSEKLTSTSTGIDVTGTVVSDGLTVDGTATFGALSTKIKVGLNGDSISSDADFYIQTSTADPLILRTNFTQRQRIEANGDISFYEDTGTTAKLFWHSSAESLGIGTSTPASPLHVFNATATSTSLAEGLTLSNNNGTTGHRLPAITWDYGTAGTPTFAAIDASRASGTGGNLLFHTATTGGTLTEAMRIDSSGNFGIGGNGTGNGLGVYLSKGTGANFFEASDGTKTMITGSDSSQDFVKIGSLSAHPVGFVVGNGEKMRIDSSGNLLVGNTVTDPATSNVNGAAITAGGEVIASLNGVAAQFNRRISDGDVAVFKKGGDTKGSIGILSSRLYIGSGDTGIKFSGADDLISPIDASDGTGRDAAIDLGSSGTRFKDLYLSSGIKVSPSAQNAATSLELGVLNSGTTAYAKIDAVNLNTYDTNLRFFTNIAGSTVQEERMRIDSSGQVRLSNTTPVWDTTFSSLVTQGGFTGSQSTSYLYS